MTTTGLVADAADTALTDAQWNAAVDEYMLAVNASKGEVDVTGFQFTGTYSFPIAHHHINEDLIRIFAHAIGDSNPLWSDHNYAKDSKWAGIIAPPLFEACVSELAKAPDQPQISGWNYYNAGGKRIYHKPIRPGDRIHAEDKWLGFEEKTDPSKPYRLFMSATERSYINQNGEKVCTFICRGVATGTPPSAQSQEDKAQFSNKKRRRYTEEELSEIHQHYADEMAGRNRRGNITRYWEDVEEGEEINRVIAGPYDITDAVAFFGSVGYSASFAIKWKALETDADRIPRDPESGEVRGAADWHLEDLIAQTRGLPYAHAFGTQMEAMISHAVTNWMGDDAFMESIDCQIRSVLFHKEVSYTTGKVSKKFEQDGKHLVELKLQSVNQDGHTYATAKALVSLRARG